MTSSSAPNVNDCIAAVERADSSPALIAAVRALGACRSETAIDTLIAVLGFNNPGAAVAAVEGLVALGETAVAPILTQLDGYDYGARAWALRALAEIGDPRALEVLLDAALGDFALSVRRAAAAGLGAMHWDLLGSPEAIVAACDRTFEVLAKVCHDDEWVVRYAAVVGLQRLGSQQQRLQERVGVVLDERLAFEGEVSVAARARWALSQAGPPEPEAMDS